MRDTAAAHRFRDEELFVKCGINNWKVFLKFRKLKLQFCLVYKVLKVLKILKVLKVVTPQKINNKRKYHNF